jgi:calcineurin-like phosphoesterase family protein
MKTWIVSDLHIGHDRDFIWEARGFKSCASHDSFILETWASTVRYDDNLIFVGDVLMGKDKMQRAHRLFAELPFKTLTWFLGNHDPELRKWTGEDVLWLQEFGVNVKHVGLAHERQVLLVDVNNQMLRLDDEGNVLLDVYEDGAVHPEGWSNFYPRSI